MFNLSHTHTHPPPPPPSAFNFDYSEILLFDKRFRAFETAYPGSKYQSLWLGKGTKINIIGMARAPQNWEIEIQELIYCS